MKTYRKIYPSNICRASKNCVRIKSKINPIEVLYWRHDLHRESISHKILWALRAGPDLTGALGSWSMALGAGPGLTEPDAPGRGRGHRPIGRGLSHSGTLGAQHGTLGA
ncbi:unnamed protein product [Lupinus luteus]|uniref:Uncharacterized protein n=1 Tax=Lupinus luteus TaxID=3873 RepID=A0AAV1XDU0_LUPLU